VLGGRKEDREIMRFLLKIRFPEDKANAMAKDGTLTQTVQTILEELDPEAAYFTPVDGARGGYVVINMDDASQIPAMVEPLFLGLGATVDIQPVMIPEDLQKAGPAMEQVAQKYG
jgi:hypothetical protein